MWFGFLIGLFVGLFSSTTGNVLNLALLGLIYGAAAGIVFGLVSYAMTGGKRDFVSRQQLQAARYDVLCEQAVIGDARKILGLAGSWPPPPSDGTATAPTESVVDRVAESVAEATGSSEPTPPATA
jgi:hypothetical protein